MGGCLVTLCWSGLVEMGGMGDLCRVLGLLICFDGGSESESEDCGMRGWYVDVLESWIGLCCGCVPVVLRRGGGPMRRVVRWS